MTQPVSRFSNIESVLVADCGSNTTRVALVEVVANAYRFVARGEAPSTLESPFNDVTIGVINAISAIESLTGKRLLLGGKLILPQQEDGSGVDAFVASSSAAEPLRVVAAGLVRDLSAASAARASHATYSTVLDTISLDDFGDKFTLSGSGDTSRMEVDLADTPEAEFSPFLNNEDRPDFFLSEAHQEQKASRKKSQGLKIFGDKQRRRWKERQVARLRRLAPNVIVLSGGSDNSPVEPLLKLVEVVLEANRQESLLAMAAGEQRRPTTFLFAGNKAAQDAILARTTGQLEVFMVDNIRPTSESENLPALQRQLSALYQERLLPGLPGYRRLSELSAVPVNTTCAAVNLMNQFLAKDISGNRILTVDIGGSNMALFYADETKTASMVRGGFGLSFGLSNVLAESSPEHVRRWLPFEAQEDELIHYALNKTLRPHILPATERELFIEGAFAREALLHMREEISREAAYSLDFNRLIGAGGPLVNVPLWQAALMLLDGLQPPGASDTGLVELELDSTMLMAAAGTLAYLNPNAATYLFRYDCLHRLGAAIVIQGEAALGAIAATVTLQRQDGRSLEVKIPFGSLVLLPLRPDERASLEIKLSNNFRIGGSDRGAVVSTAPGREITGGALGLIIDARGRPIYFADTPETRQQQVAAWYNVYREALRQAEEDGSDDFVTRSGPSQPAQPVTGLVAKGGLPFTAAPTAKPARKLAAPKTKPAKAEPAPKAKAASSNSKKK